MEPVEIHEFFKKSTMKACQRDATPTLIGIKYGREVHLIVGRL